MRLVVILVLAVAACASPCIQVMQAVCLCSGQTTEQRTQCEDYWKAQEKLDPPTDAELATCEQILPGCEALVADGAGCDDLRTDEGRRTCGMTAR